MITIILVLISAIAKAAMDILQFDFYNSIFSKYGNYFNPEYSWKNKWNEDLSSERFLFSTTILVWITDGWHLFQFIFLNLLIIGIMFYDPKINILLDFVILRILFGITFELFYSIIFRKVQC